MKKSTIALCLIIVTLAISLWACVNMLIQTKNELADTQAELEARKDVWWKLRTLSSNYHGKLMLSVPDFYDKASQNRIVARNDDWDGFRYEFSADGKTAHFFRLDQEQREWSLRPKADEPKSDE